MSAHKYELMFIADPELDERGLKKLTEQYLETVTKKAVPSRTSTSGAVASLPTKSPARPKVTTSWSTTPLSRPPATNSIVC